MKKGFTLVELLIATLIFSIFIIGVYSVLEVGNFTVNRDMGMLELQQQARAAVEAIANEAREASYAGVSGTGNGILAINTPLGNNIQFYLNGNQCIRLSPDGITTKVLANNINSLVFSLSDANKVLTIQIVAQKTVDRRTLNFPFMTKVRLRNG